MYDYENFIKFSGELAEWSNAAVLKTVEPKGSGGSNPSLSASVIFKKGGTYDDGDFNYCMHSHNVNLVLY